MDLFDTAVDSLNFLLGKSRFSLVLVRSIASLFSEPTVGGFVRGPGEGQALTAVVSG